MEYKVKDIKLADLGKKKIEWAEKHMPVLMSLREEYKALKPFNGLKIGGAIHVTKETGVLVRTLQELGAKVAWAGCNPLSTKDDIAAALALEGVNIYAWHGLNKDEYYWCIDKVIETGPNFTMDDGCDVVVTLHDKYPSLVDRIIAGTEETTTGVHRLEAMANKQKLRYPILAVNNAETKWDFDNVYGTGQGTLDGILRATNVLITGKNFVVAGYGHCGRGVAMRARGAGARRVIVTEVDYVQALKAAMDGFEVMTMDKAASIGDIFVTATGCKDVIRKKHFLRMKPGAVLSNTGHFNVEINVDELEELAVGKEKVRENNDKFILPDGGYVYLLAEGRLVNLSSAEGHPSEVMDLSFSNQIMGIMYLLKNHDKLENKVYTIPKDVDKEIAKRKLESFNIKIDKLTRDQEKYLNSFDEGT